MIGGCYVFPGRNSDKPASNNTMLLALYPFGYSAVALTILNKAGSVPT